MNGEEIHEKMKCRAERLRAENLLQIKGAKHGQGKGHPWAEPWARGEQKQAREGHFQKCAFLKEGVFAVFCAYLRAELLWSGPKSPMRSGEGCP